MDKNHVKRHGMPGELAKDSEALKGSKQFHVNEARNRGKSPYLIWGGLLVVFERAEVSRSRSSRWSHDHPGKLVKASHRAKG